MRAGRRLATLPPDILAEALLTAKGLQQDLLTVALTHNPATTAKHLELAAASRRWEYATAALWHANTTAGVVEAVTRHHATVDGLPKTLLEHPLVTDAALAFMLPSVSSALRFLELVAHPNASGRTITAAVVKFPTLYVQAKEAPTTQLIVLAAALTIVTHSQTCESDNHDLLMYLAEEVRPLYEFLIKAPKGGHTPESLEEHCDPSADPAARLFAILHPHTPAAAATAAAESMHKSSKLHPPLGTSGLHNMAPIFVEAVVATRRDLTEAQFETLAYVNSDSGSYRTKASALFTASNRMCPPALLDQLAAFAAPHTAEHDHAWLVLQAVLSNPACPYPTRVKYLPALGADVNKESHYQSVVQLWQELLDHSQQYGASSPKYRRMSSSGAAVQPNPTAELLRKLHGTGFAYIAAAQPLCPSAIRPVKLVPHPIVFAELVTDPADLSLQELDVARGLLNTWELSCAELATFVAALR